MTEAPREIWATVNGMRSTLPGVCRVEIGGWESAPNKPRAVRYIRADAALELPEIAEFVEAVRDEAEARNLYLMTGPDRGGMHGAKGQRKAALDAAQLRTLIALTDLEQHARDGLEHRRGG